MKGTGIRVKIDDLGRLVIPVKMREKVGFNKQDELDVYIEGNKLILSKPTDVCVFCNSSSNLTLIKTKHVCLSCIDVMNRL